MKPLTRDLTGELDGWIADVAVPALKEQITDAITPSIEDALNDVFAQSMPYPSKCSS
jgi:hypothetical protein